MPPRESPQVIYLHCVFKAKEFKSALWHGASCLLGSSSAWMKASFPCVGVCELSCAWLACAFVSLTLLYKGSCCRLDCSLPRCTLFRMPELWLRLYTLTTKSVHPSRWCIQQMVPPTRQWTVQSTHWSTSTRWKLHRHVKDWF